MKGLAQVQIENMRRCLLEILNETGSGLHGVSVRRVLDGLNHPTTWEHFIAQVEYLSGEELVRVFSAAETREFNDLEEGKYLMMLRQASYDSQEARQMMLRIRQRGRRFLEGNAPEVKGVATE